MELFIVLLFLLIVAISTNSVNEYVKGHSAYNAAVAHCGREPVLGDSGIESKTYIAPGTEEYERLKYSVGEDKILGPGVYFCTVTEAKSAGYSGPQTYP